MSTVDQLRASMSAAHLASARPASPTKEETQTVLSGMLSQETSVLLGVSNKRKRPLNEGDPRNTYPEETKSVYLRSKGLHRRKLQKSGQIYPTYGWTLKSSKGQWILNNTSWNKIH